MDEKRGKNENYFYERDECENLLRNLCRLNCYERERLLKRIREEKN